MLGVDIAHPERDLLRAAHQHALALLDGLHKTARLHQAVRRARIKPGAASAELLHLQIARLHIQPVEVGDLQFPPRGGLHARGQLRHPGIVEIQTDHRPIRLRRARLLLDLQRAALGIHRHHAVAFRVSDAIGEDGGAGFAPGRLLQLRRQMIAKDHVVAQCQRAGLPIQPVAPDMEGLSQPVRRGLFGIGEAHPQPRAIAEQATELRQIGRRRDHQNVANARQHQHRERIIHHRLVIHRQQLLARRQRHRVQACAGAAGEQNALHAAAPVAVPRRWPP